MRQPAPSDGVSVRPKGPWPVRRDCEANLLQAAAFSLSARGQNPYEREASR